MNSRERVLGAFNRTGYDRIPVKHEGTPEINQMIMDHFGLNNMEQLLRVVGDDFRYADPVYLKIMDARFQFYYDMHEKVLQAAEGMVDFTHIGEDLGTQTAQLLNFEIFEKHFAPKYQKYFEMVHSYGARSMMHMCGCIRAFLPRLIELGLDVYDVVQPTTPEMDIAVLKIDFGDKITFCGSVCVQTTLAFGRVDDVINEVERRMRLFSEGGLFLGPSHAIQVGSPLENMYNLNCMF